MNHKTTVLVTTNGTGKATAADMAKAEKLLKGIIKSVGRHKIAEQFVVSVNTTYQWKLVPSQYLPVFWAAFCKKNGPKMEELRPDMFTMKG